MKNFEVKKSVERGHVISFIKGKVHHKKNKSEKDTMDNPCWVGIAKDTWIDPAFPYKFINHSCNPSASIKGRVTLVALRDLNPGDEITIDYSVTEMDTKWHMRCRCGEKNCRKNIRSIQLLSRNTVNRYLPFIPTYFKQKVLGL